MADYLRVAIGWRQASHLGNLLSAVDEDIVPIYSVAVLIAVDICDNGKLCVQEIIFLSKDLGAHAGVDPRSRVILVAGAIDMACAKAYGRKP